jgi:hypothetical protein
MPELFWNVGAQDKKKGLDVLGLRGIDQELERRWVAFGCERLHFLEVLIVIVGYFTIPARLRV